MIAVHQNLQPLKFLFVFLDFSHAPLEFRVVVCVGNIEKFLSHAAHFRDRLQRSAEASAERLGAAQAVVDRAAEATRAAKRDQTAIEKLIERADADALIKAIRELEKAPSVRKIRHDPC